MGNIFDFNDGDFIFSTSGNLGIDTNGDLNMRMGDHTSIDLNTGELHLNTGWKKIMTMRMKTNKRDSNESLILFICDWNSSIFRNLLQKPLYNF